jgi:hypothetical protein
MGLVADLTSVAVALVVVAGVAATAVAVSRLPRVAVHELEPDPL